MSLITPKVLKEARRCELVLRDSFPFRWSASEVQAKWPVSAHTHRHSCWTDSKSFENPQLVWTGMWNLQRRSNGERQTNRARMKTATHGADEGRLDLQKSVLTSRRQKFCESATARPHDGAVKWGQRLPNSRFVPSPRCSNKITILCKHIEACSCTSYCDMHVPVHALANCSHHSSIVHCLHPVTSCKACRCAFDQRSVGI